MKRNRYTPTYKFDVSSSTGAVLLHQAPARSAGHNLYLEKISPALVCGRERAALTVSIHKTHSDTEQSVPAHSREWVSPGSLLRLFMRVPGDAGAFNEVIHASFKNKAQSASAAI